MSQNKLPADPISLILGIIGLLFGIATCCMSVFLLPFGIIAVVPLIITIIGLIVANRSLRLYRTNPEIYAETSRSNVSMARILNIIVLLFSAISIITLIIGVVSFGKSLVNSYDRVDTEDTSRSYPYDIEEERIDIEEEEDTLNVQEAEILDTVIIESQATN